MKVSEAFPSKYLSASDLRGQNVRVVMQHVEMEKIGDDNKPVLYFKGKDKGLSLNKTNAKTIAELFGDDTDDWNGGELILYPIMTEYQGKPVEGIRVRAPQPKDGKPAAPAKPAEMPAGGDDIPFLVGAPSRERTRSFQRNLQ